MAGPWHLPVCAAPRSHRCRCASMADNAGAARRFAGTGTVVVSNENTSAGFVTADAVKVTFVGIAAGSDRLCRRTCPFVSYEASPCGEAACDYPAGQAQPVACCQLFLAYCSNASISDPACVTPAVRDLIAVCTPTTTTSTTTTTAPPVCPFEFFAQSPCAQAVCQVKGDLPLECCVQYR